MTHPPRPAFHFTVGITGHRPPVMDSPTAQRVRPRLDLALAMLTEAAQAVRAAHSAFFADAAPVLRMVTPLAEGADQLATEIALAQGYGIQAILPLPPDEYRQDFVDEDARNAFDQLLGRASCVLELPRPAEGRNAAYALAGRATLAHSDVLIAVWNGEPARGRGGTGEVVASALRRGMPVIHIPIDQHSATTILWSGYGLFIDTDEVEAVPSRLFSQDALNDLLTDLLAPPPDPHERRFIAQFFAEQELRTRARAEYPLMLAALGVTKLRRTAFRTGAYAEDTGNELRDFRNACADGSHGVMPSLDGIESAYCWADRLAQHFAQTYRSGHVLNFLLGATAVLLALCGLLFNEIKLWLAIAELIAVGGFVLNTRVGVAHDWHRRWLDYRQLAERIRPMRSLKLLGAAAPLLRRGRSGASRWLDWYAAAVWRAGGCPPGRVTDQGALARLIIAQELQPQIDYHRGATRQLHLIDHRLHRVGMALFAASLLSGIVFVIGYVVANEWVRANAGLFIVLSAGLPALGAAIFGIRVQGDFGGSAERSAGTAGNLADIVAAFELEQLGLSRTIDLVEGAASTMLADLGEWRLAYQRRELELPA
jgi:hypothetical protein